MRFRLTHVLPGILFGIFAAAVLSAPAAHAFTFENKDAAGDYSVPKFDVEEQAKNFRKDGSGTAANGKTSYDTPIGKLEFGVGQGTSHFGAFGSGFGPTPRDSRADFNRVVTPENLR